jgi:HSP20 family protein
MAEKQSETAATIRDQNRNTRSTQLTRAGGSSFFMNPFALLGRLAEEMTGVFAEAGTPRGAWGGRTSSLATWAPDVDVVQRGNELVVRADLPGVNPDDVVVEVSDDAITLSGERQEERQEERHGVYRIERSYGSFFRAIPLPDGAIVDQAKANFKDGVLEITVPAPPEQVSRGRRLEISRGERSAEKRESSTARTTTSS